MLSCIMCGADKVAANAGYHLQAQDVLHWERQHGRVPTGSVVMVRLRFRVDVGV